MRAPAIPVRKGFAAVLALKARLDRPRFGGTNNFLALAVNGRPVTERTGRTRFAGEVRLLNRRSPSFHGAGEPYFKGDRLNVLFGPSFDARRAAVAADADQVFLYRLDVTDLLRRDTENLIELRNTARSRWFGLPKDSGEPALVIGRCAIEVISASEAARAPLRVAEKPPKPCRALALEAKWGRVAVAPAGGLEVRVGRDAYFIETTFSRPGGGRNALRFAPAPAARWERVEARLLGASQIEITAQDKSYLLVRRVTRRGHRLEIRDELTNRTSRVIGVAFETTILPAAEPEDAYLAGYDKWAAAGSHSNPTPNPTALWALKRSALGFVAEDSAFRLQLEMTLSGRRLALAARHLGLKPRETYAVRWALYPRRRPDYWSFINTVRADWRVNFTIPGCFGFYSGDPILKVSDEYLRNWLTRRGITILAIGPWWGDIFGNTRTEQEQAALFLAMRNRIKSLCPNVRIVTKVQTILAMSSPRGRDPFADSQIILPDGRPLERAAFRTGRIWGLPKGRVRYHHYPAPGGSWVRQIKRWVRLTMETAKCDGVYFDTFSYANTPHYARFTYDKWDGRTVDIDPRTGEVVRRYGDLALLSEPVRRELVELVHKYGGLAVANDMPRTEGMQRLRMLRITETTSPAGYARCHLYTPTPLGYTPAYRTRKSWSTEADRIDEMRSKLAVGCLYTFYSDYPQPSARWPTCFMYPITPVELHAGWVKGEERIVTMVSGRYGWGPGSVGKVLLFDRRGHLIEKPPRDAVAFAKDGVDISAPENGMAIILRRRP